MEKILEKYFDRYTILARIMPGFAVLVPFIIFIYLKYNFFDIKGMGLAAILITSLIAVLAKISRDLGKKKEDKLFKELGAPFTTILLRYSDTEIDSITKDRYHLILNNNIPNLNLPLNLNDELLDIKKSDDKYSSATRWLRNKTRDKKIYPLVFKDNVNYGFVRNLLGLKFPAIVFYMLLFIFEFMKTFSIENTTSFISVFDKGFFWILSNMNISLFLILSTGIILILFVNKNMLISSAKAYARSLLEACENI